jgi:hypothetical protein
MRWCFPIIYHVHAAFELLCSALLLHCMKHCLEPKILIGIFQEPHGRGQRRAERAFETMQESEKGEKGHQKIQGKRREHEEPEDPGSREQHAMSGSHKPHKESSVVGFSPLCNTSSSRLEIL